MTPREALAKSEHGDREAIELLRQLVYQYHDNLDREYWYRVERNRWEEE